MTTWPNPERPGVPLNPEVDGWHWVERYPGVKICLSWCAAWHENANRGWGKFQQDDRLADWTYLGPVHTDADVQAAAKVAIADEAQNPWKRAIIDACMTWHISPDENDPKATLQRVLECETKVALNPLVSAEARELQRAARLKALEDAKSICAEISNKNMPTTEFLKGYNQAASLCASAMRVAAVRSTPIQLVGSGVEIRALKECGE